MNRELLAHLRRYTLIPVGVLLIVIGVFFFFSPFPIGVPFAGVGMFLLLANSTRALRIVRRMRARFHWLDRRVRRIEEKLSGRLRETLEQSRPEMLIEELAAAAGRIVSDDPGTAPNRRRSRTRRNGCRRARH